MICTGALMGSGAAAVVMGCTGLMTIRPSNSGIATWVAAHYTAKTVGSSTVYDLTQSTSS